MSRLLPQVLLFLLFALGGCRLAPPANSELLNGSFEQPLSVGWQEESGTEYGAAFERSDTFGQPGAGKAAKVMQDDQGYARLSQTVELPDLFYMLMFDARFTVGGSISCNPVARISTVYLDGSNRQLGRTEWYLSGSRAFSSSDTCHRQVVASAGVWTGFELNISDELADSLSGVNPASVKRLRIVVEPQVEFSG